MQYWYSAQLRQYRLQFVRAFSGFYVKTGRGGPNDSQELLQVPCRYGDPTRIASTIVSGNSENKVLATPFITCVVSNLAMAPNRRQDPKFTDAFQINERKYDTNLQRYTNDIGRRYTVERYMPVPYDLTMQVDFWTNNLDIKEQLLEQILVLYNPAIDIQTSTNPIDWTVLSIIEMQDSITWTSRTIPVGTDNPIDVATMMFKVPIWINPPAKIQKQAIIQEIITNIYQGEQDPSTLLWTETEFLSRSVTTPKNATILVSNIDSYTCAISLCDESSSTIDKEHLPTVTFASQYPQLFAGMSFTWNNITITVNSTVVVDAVNEIRSFLSNTNLNCVLYNDTSMQFINTVGGDNVFVDVIPGSLAALGLQNTTYPGGTLAWWRLLLVYGSFKPYSLYGTNGTQLRLKTVDDLDQYNTDIVGWVDIDPVDQNKLIWYADQQSLPATAIPAIDAIVDPTTSGPSINLPASTVGQRYLLSKTPAQQSASWGLFVADTTTLVTSSSATWTTSTDVISLTIVNNLIQPGQTITSESSGIPDNTYVVAIDNQKVTISNTLTTTQSSPTTVNFYSNVVANDIVVYDGVNWIVDWDSTANEHTTQYVLNNRSNRIYIWSNGYWAPLIHSKYTPGYWTLAI